MKRRIVWLTLLGVGAYLLFLLATVPAQFVFARIVADMPPGLRVGAVNGTVWRGTLTDLQWQNWRIAQLDWNLRAGAFLTATLTADIDARLDKGFAEFQFEYAADDVITLRDLRAALPLQRVAGYAGLPAGMAQGDLTLQLSEAQFIAMRPASLRGQVALTNLTVTWLGAQSLGDYEALIETTGEEIRASVKDLQGPVQLQAITVLLPEGTYRVEGTVAARDTGNQKLVEMLRYLGPQDAAGAHRFRFSGRLR